MKKTGLNWRVYDFSVDYNIIGNYIIVILSILINIWWKTRYKIMFGFILKMFIGLASACTIGFFGNSVAFNSEEPMKCVSLNNQSSQTRLTIVNINSDKVLFYSFTVSVNRSGGSCNTIDDQNPRVFVPNKAKNMNLKVLNLIPVVNKRKFLVQHESVSTNGG